MKAIIEIPDNVIQSACRAIAITRPALSSIAMLTRERMRDMDTLTIEFDAKEQKETIEANIAMMCVTQVMGKMIEGYERN